jgi:hypothetical protein
MAGKQEKGLNNMKHMKTLLLSVVLLSLFSGARAQSPMHKSPTQQSHAEKSPTTLPTALPATLDAQKSFTLLKTLAGTWKGPVTTDPVMHEMGDGMSTQVSLRVTSRGNAIVHEMHDPGVPDDPTRYDHPVTMLYLDSDRLTLTHYCDAGNRPRMVARTSPDGKTVEFDFLDVAGSTQYGHMHHAVFTIIDANHHIEDWTYMLPGDKPMHAHLDLMRAQ